MAMQTETSSNKLQDGPIMNSSGSIDGNVCFPTVTDVGSFFGATPITRPTAAAQATITDASGGTAAPTNGILTLTGSYNSAILANALATIAAQSNAIQAALVSLGLIKGS
jgi:hypothetical protein